MDHNLVTMRAPWQDKLERIVFGVDTRGGRAFDVALLVTILLSVFVVLLESVPGLQREYAAELRVAEWFFTGLFTLEYTVRLLCVQRPRRYATSFFGIVDLLAVIPTFVSLFFTGAQSLAVIRAVRLLRVFRVLKLTHYVGEARILGVALRASRAKITVFIFTVVVVVVIVGAMMYFIEGPERGFTSIPIAMYWAIVTMTTVGYGDIAPMTVTGRFVASLLMILGYGIIAVPTGIVSAELAQAARAEMQSNMCPGCGVSRHQTDARYCRLCGTALPELAGTRRS